MHLWPLFCARCHKSHDGKSFRTERHHPLMATLARSGKNSDQNVLNQLGKIDETTDFHKLYGELIVSHSLKRNL